MPRLSVCRRVLPRAACWIALWALALAPAAAQTAAQLSGLVRDPSGASVSSAHVTVIHMGSGIRRATNTGTDGWYAVSSLPQGEYKITVRKPGFRTLARLAVPLSYGEAARLDFDLQIGAMHEFITVEGGVSTLNIEDASSGVRLDGEAARSLPVNGRTLQGLIAFAPGVLATPATLGEAGQFSVNGQRPNANYFVTDGVSANSGVGAAGLPGQFSGGTLPAMTALGSLQGVAIMGEVREMMVKTSTFAPEFGRMPGAQILVTTRAGTNRFHGEALYALRHERLSGSDLFASRAALAQAPLRLSDLHVSLGGPVQKDKTFFFGSMERLRVRQPSVWRTPTLTLQARERASGAARNLLDAFPLPQQELSLLYGESTVQTSWPGQVTAGSFRLDRSLETWGSLFLRYHDAPSANRVGLVQQNQSEFRTSSLTVGVTHSPGFSVVNDVRLNLSRTVVESSWFPGLGGETALAGMKALFPAANTLPPRQLYGVSIGGLGQLIWSDRSVSRQGQFQLVDTVAIASGRHQVRLGLDYLRLTPSRREAIRSAVARFDSLDDLLAGRQPVTMYGEAPGGTSLIELASAFAQDTWSVNSRMNLTYGLRWEYMPPPSSRGGAETQVPIVVAPSNGSESSGSPVFPPDGTRWPILPITNSPPFAANPAWSSRFGRFAPRVGAACRLNRAGTFVARAGAGVFYDLGFASAIDPLNSVPFNSWRTTVLEEPTAGSIPVYGFARDLRVPLSWQWNVTLERAASGWGTASAAWVGSTGRHLLRREGYLATGATSPSLLLGTSHGSSQYQAFQAHWRRAAAGLGWIASYTWSHSIDNGSWDSGSYLIGNGITARSDRGSSNFDVRHLLTVGFQYDVPSGSLPRLAQGWSLHGIIRAQTGFPLDVLAHENAFGLGFDNLPRPDLVPGVPVWLSDPGVPSGRKLNAAAFSLPPMGQQGTLGRNALRGTGWGQWDAAIERKFALPSASALHFRVQMFNVLNTSAFADPIRVLSSPLFGQPASLINLMYGTGRPTSGITPAFQAGGPRTTELSVSWVF